MLDLERQLFDAQASGNDGLAREIQNRIDKEQMALDLMNKLGISIDEAREKAEKLAAVNAGPDINQSGFVTPKEQKAWDKKQKALAKEQKARERAEIAAEKNVSAEKRKRPSRIQAQKDKNEMLARVKAGEKKEDVQADIDRRNRQWQTAARCST
jgi:hypothetical protein